MLNMKNFAGIILNHLDYWRMFLRFDIKNELLYSSSPYLENPLIPRNLVAAVFSISFFSPTCEKNIADAEYLIYYSKTALNLFML